jgi:hypothetical protein
MRAFGALPPGVRAVVTVAATSLFMVLVAWATLIGPDQVFTGPGPSPATLTTTTESCIPLPTKADGTIETPDNPRNLPYCEEPDTSRQQAEDVVRQTDPPFWLRVLVFALELLLLCAVVALLAFAVLVVARALRRRARSQEEREEVGFTTLGEPARLAAAIAEDVVEQDRLLLDGEPRNAIVATWLRFEVQGAGAGVPRRSWETSSEYAIRILDVVAADSGAVNRLAGLYREARFSPHPITEEHRAAAVDALAAIRRSLGART